MSAILTDHELRLAGFVGDYFLEDGFTSADVVAALAQVAPETDLTVHINSAGGVAFEGAAIHAVLVARPGRTDIVVEGVAMSAASLIAMAGDTVTMSAGSIMMIHDPSAYTYGTTDEHMRSIAGLEALATAYARVYADKSGKSVAECREIMKAETWFTPQQAVAAGFADETTERKAEPVAAFDYRVFANAPKRLVAMATKKDWRLPGVQAGPARAVAENRQPKELSMTDKVAVAQAVAQARARSKAIMSGANATDNTELATFLDHDTEVTPEQATMILDLASKGGSGGNGNYQTTAQYDAARMGIGAGLSGPLRPDARGSNVGGSVDLVATMKSRAGIAS